MGSGHDVLIESRHEAHGSDGLEFLDRANIADEHPGVDPFDIHGCEFITERGDPFPADRDSAALPPVRQVAIGSRTVTGKKAPRDVLQSSLWIDRCRVGRGGRSQTALRMGEAYALPDAGREA